MSRLPGASGGDGRLSDGGHSRPFPHPGVVGPFSSVDFASDQGVRAQSAHSCTYLGNSTERVPTCEAFSPSCSFSVPLPPGPRQPHSTRSPRSISSGRRATTHSLNAYAFLSKAQTNDAKIRVHMFEVEQRVFNAMLLAKVYERIGLPGLALVPLIIIGKHVIIGYSDEATTGREILDRIAECRKARHARSR